MLLLPLSIDHLIEFHDHTIADAIDSDGQAISTNADLNRAIVENHRFNCLLWAEEDLARRPDVNDALIAANKRAIDGFNQKRNDATERIDESLLAELALGSQPPGVQNSETAGAMVDRLSILALKIYHMGLQAQRQDASAEHRRLCADKHALLVLQRRDLAMALKRLLEGCRNGTAYFRIYRQFKMYNDASLNPQIYGAKAQK